MIEPKAHSEQSHLQLEQTGKQEGFLLLDVLI